jgi:SAM-dependent methyltransferase
MNLRPQEIGRSYDQLASKWQEAHLQTNGLPQFERAIRFCKNRGPALDIGCGSSGRFIDLLQRHGFEAEGLDVSEKMIALARERHPQVRFYQADICGWPFPRAYDFIAGWDSIWHVLLDEQEVMLRKTCAGLAPGGVFIFTTGGVDEPEEKSDSAMGVPVSYGVLGIPRTLEILAQAGCICRHLEYDQFPEPHLYLIAQKG